jgi:hypothetical protein
LTIVILYSQIQAILAATAAAMAVMWAAVQAVANPLMVLTPKLFFIFWSNEISLSRITMATEVFCSIVVIRLIDADDIIEVDIDFNPSNKEGEVS